MSKKGNVELDLLARSILRLGLSNSIKKQMRGTRVEDILYTTYKVLQRRYYSKSIKGNS